ncbi:MAG: hypothetical protein H7235_03675 [Bdellovibrionaceae bacterium]|nr:hypothetical protein [Pseudobdellovibrionaceae bacterium]
MKNIKYLISLIVNLVSLHSFAQDHVEHAKHNMVLFGEADAYYASHIVYKKPHNFQVILKVTFDPNAKSKIANEMMSHSKDQFIFLLDHMDISKINEKPGISGQIFRTNADGSKQIIFEQMALKDTEYSIVYFDELPLSLSDTKNELSEISVNSEKK